MALARRPVGGERHDVANRAPEGARLRLVQACERAEGFEQVLQRGSAVHDRRRHAFEPQRRGTLSGREIARGARCERGGEVGGAGDVARRAHGGRHRVGGARRIEAEHQHGRLGLGPRQRLDRDVRHCRKRAPRSGHELAQVVAGDVLDHAAARLEFLAAPGHRSEAEEMIARRARPDAARARQIGGEHAADRRLARRPPEQRAVVHRLEGELLRLRVEQVLDLGERRAGARREHQLLGLVKRDAGERGQIERRIDLRGPAERALGAVADDLEGFLLRQRPLDGGLDVLGVPGLMRVGHRAPRHSAAAAAAASPANDGMISRAKRVSWSRPPAMVSST